MMPRIPKILETLLPPGICPSLSRILPEGLSTTSDGAENDEGDVKS